MVIHEEIQCISIGKTATCQLLFSCPSILTLPRLALALFYKLGKFRSICEKDPFLIPLFVGKHLKEIEVLNDKSVCIQSGAGLEDCMEERPICWEQPALGGVLAGGCHNEALLEPTRFDSGQSTKKKNKLKWVL